MNLFDEKKAVIDFLAAYDLKRLNLTQGQVFEIIIDLRATYHPFKLLQRALALVISTIYILSWLVVFALKIRFPAYEVPIEALNGPLGIAFAAVTGLYFAGGTLNKK